MSVSQATISRQVGVSRTAVSHVLNGRGHMVSDETRERILKAVEASGYHRNALVRALRSNRTHVVGIVVPDADFSFFGKMIQAAEKEASAHGLQCFLCQSHSLPDQFKKDVSALREYRVDGILVVPASSYSTPEVYLSLLKHAIPFVIVDVPIAGIEMPFVGNDNVQAGEIATDHLLGLGHRRIACVRGFQGNPGSAERFEGYRRALKRARVAMDERLVVGNGFEFEPGRDTVAELLDRGVDFSAVVTPSDFVALGAIQELTSRGLRVPADVSLVGCGNLSVSSMVTPPLTTVDQHPQELGRRAMEILIKQIEGHSKSIPRVVVKPTLIERASTAKIASR